MEDFLTYDEVDPDGVMTVTPTRVTLDGLPSSAANQPYLYADKGIDHFGDFEHQFTLYIESYAPTGWSLHHWALTNEISNGIPLWAKGLGLAAWGPGGDLRLHFIDYETGEEGFWELVERYIAYYLTIKRQGTIATCWIYSDAGRSTLLKQLTINPCATTPYRYIYGMAGREHGPAGSAGSYTENLDLGEAPSGGQGYMLTGGSTF